MSHFLTYLEYVGWLGFSYFRVFPHCLDMRQTGHLFTVGAVYESWKHSAKFINNCAHPWWRRESPQKQQVSTRLLHHCDGAFHINSWIIAMTESVGWFLNVLAVTVTGPFCRMLMRFITSIQSLRDLWKQSRAKSMMHDRWHQGNWCNKGLVFQNRLFLLVLWFFLASPVSLLFFYKVQLNPRPYVSSLAFQSAAQLGVDNANKVKLDKFAGCYTWAKDQWGCHGSCLRVLFT